MHSSALLATLILVLSACTHAPQRRPAAVCLANGQPMDMDQVRLNALETMDQYQGIQAYMKKSFIPRLQRELSESGPKSCHDEYRGLSADLEMSLAYFRSKQRSSASLGMRVADSRLIESLACMKPLADELKPAFEQMKSGFNESIAALEIMQMEYREFSARHPSKCAARFDGDLKRILPSLVQTSGMTSGSGFLVEVGAQKYLVTAAHVSQVSVKTPEQIIDVKIGESKAVEQEQMQLSPGEFNAALDISLKKTSRRTPALKAASALELGTLEPGHKFYAIGFPKREQPAAIPCWFEGFAPGQRKSREAQMLLYCAGRSRAIGISGGPLIDEQGRVWGMNSSEAAYSGALLVTPVLENLGRLQVGIQQVFLSQLCYERNLASPRTCQVMPNMFESQVP